MFILPQYFLITVIVDNVLVPVIFIHCLNMIRVQLFGELRVLHFYALMLKGVKKEHSKKKKKKKNQ